MITHGSNNIRLIDRPVTKLEFFVFQSHIPVKFKKTKHWEIQNSNAKNSSSGFYQWQLSGKDGNSWRIFIQSHRISGRRILCLFAWRISILCIIAFAWTVWYNPFCIEWPSAECISLWNKSSFSSIHLFCIYIYIYICVYHTWKKF